MYVRIAAGRLHAGEYTVVMLRTLRSPEVESTNWLEPFVADFRCGHAHLHLLPGLHYCHAFSLSALVRFMLLVSAPWRGCLACMYAPRSMHADSVAACRVCPGMPSTQQEWHY